MSATAPTGTPETNALLLAWSRIFSPLVPEDWRVEAWRALALPGSWAEHEPEFWQRFQVGVPAPPVPLLLHAALSLEGEGVREDWMRVTTHLGLRWQSARLPPDHLGPACEVLACALEAGEGVLVGMLCERYLLPWCRVARDRLAELDSALRALPEAFERELRKLPPA